MMVVAVKKVISVVAINSCSTCEKEQSVVDDDNDKKRNFLENIKTVRFNYRI